VGNIKEKRQGIKRHWEKNTAWDKDSLGKSTGRKYTGKNVRKTPR
jgi:hypothetical protein